ncbi:MAG: helix-hairpin-helix domain-containing protein [Bacteroidales bacterium]|nr:helix-hairpin-helix domain-containing protein [Bacteroidales bacterium]
MERRLTLLASRLCGVVAMCISINMYAQEVDSHAIIDEMTENMAADGLLNENASEDIAEMHAMLERKIDLNTCSEEDLQRLIFLKHSQIRSIMLRRNKVKAFCSVYELQTIENIDAQTVERLNTFVTCEPIEMESKQSRISSVGAVVRAYTTYPQAKGFKSIDGKEPAYEGKPVGMLARLSLQHGEKWSAGAVLESDPGEPIASHGVTLTDFTSAFVQYSNRGKMLRQVIVGHYTARFGQGLGLWTGFASDGATSQTSLNRNAYGVMSTLSAAESGYLRGVAAYIVPSLNWRVTVFGSYTDGDVSTATTVVNEDSITKIEALTIQNDGYHRTKSELDGRNNFGQTLYGAVLTRSWQRVTSEVGYNQWHASIPLGTSDDLYRLNYPTGQNIGVAHADYRMYLPKVQAYGEVAYQTTHAVGMMQGVDVDMQNGNQLTLAARYFSPKYFTIYQNPYSRAGHAGGERGLRASLLISPRAGWSLFADVDVYRNSWLLYQKYAPSGGYKARFYLNYNINRNNALRLSLRHDDYDYASSINSKILTVTRRTALRFRWEAHPFVWARFISTVDKVFYGQQESGQHTEGFSMAERVSLHFSQPKLSADFVLAHFDTDDYNTRIYASHPEVRYAMSMPAYYYRGVQCVGQISWEPMRRLTIWLRGDYVHYYDRETISQGNQQINKSHLFNGKVQVSYYLQHYRHRKQPMNKAVGDGARSSITEDEAEDEEQDE